MRFSQPSQSHWVIEDWNGARTVHCLLTTPYPEVWMAIVCCLIGSPFRWVGTEWFFRFRKEDGGGELDVEILGPLAG
jgi:hypothetical protein